MEINQLPNWVTISQNLTTVTCQHCGATYEISADMEKGVRLSEYIALMEVAAQNFGVHHKECPLKESQP